MSAGIIENDVGKYLLPMPVDRRYSIDPKTQALTMHRLQTPEEFKMLYTGKPMQRGVRNFVSVNFEGNPLPFYLSSGAAGKEITQAGKWYPFFGFGKESPWINKGYDADLANYYGNKKWEDVARWLDARIGDIRNSQDSGRVATDVARESFLTASGIKRALASPATDETFRKAFHRGYAADPYEFEAIQLDPETRQRYIDSIRAKAQGILPDGTQARGRSGFIDVSGLNKGIDATIDVAKGLRAYARAGGPVAEILMALPDFYEGSFKRTGLIENLYDRSKGELHPRNLPIEISDRFVSGLNEVAEGILNITPFDYFVYGRESSPNLTAALEFALPNSTAGNSQKARQEQKDRLAKKKEKEIDDFSRSIDELTRRYENSKSQPK